MNLCFSIASACVFAIASFSARDFTLYVYVWDLIHILHSNRYVAYHYIPLHTPLHIMHTLHTTLLTDTPLHIMHMLHTTLLSINRSTNTIVASNTPINQLSVQIITAHFTVCTNRLDICFNWSNQNVFLYSTQGL